MTVALFLDADGRPRCWWRTTDTGDGTPVIAPGERVVAVPPADAVTLHWAELPDRSQPQAVTAARLLVTEVTAAPMIDLHVAVGREGDATDRPIAVVGARRMATWLASLAVLGIDPDAVIPAALLVPRPEAGFIRAVVGGQAIVRAPGSAFVDEPGLTDILTGGTAPVDLDDDAVTAGIAAALVAVPLDLRQGPFARRRRRAIDWRLVRRLVWLAMAFAALTLLIEIVKIARYHVAAAAIEAEADRLARSGLGPGETVTDADRQLTARLARLQGGGAGFSRTAAAVFAAAREVPGTKLTALAFEPSGALRVSVSSPTDAAVTELERRIEIAGFIVTPGALTNSAGRVTGQLTVSGR